MFLQPEKFDVNTVLCFCFKDKFKNWIWNLDRKFSKDKGGREAKRYLNKMFTVSSN